MTSETHEHKMKIISLDEEQKAHEELEKACNDVNGSTKRVFEWTVFLIRKTCDRYLKESKDKDEDLRKICRDIWKKHPQHKRQIQRVFDWKDPNTGDRPYRRFKGKYGEEDEAELHITAKSPKSILLDKLKNEQKVTYDAFQSEAADSFAKEIQDIQELVRLEGLPGDDLRKLLYKLQDAGTSIEKELITSRGMKSIVPTNVDTSYSGHNSKDDKAFPGVPKPEHEPIRLQAAEVPKSEQLRLLQQLEGKLLYASSRIYRNMGDSLIKMNYISDDPKISERLITHYIQEMMILAFTSIQILNEFMKYFEKFKSKESLTEEDKTIIRRLLHTLYHVTQIARDVR